MEVSSMPQTKLEKQGILVTNLRKTQYILSVNSTVSLNIVNSMDYDQVHAPPASCMQDWITARGIEVIQGFRPFG